MYQCRIDHRSLLGVVEQVVEVAQMTVTATDSVASAVLVQNEHLTRTEPTLETTSVEQNAFGHYYIIVTDGTASC